MRDAIHSIYDAAVFGDYPIGDVIEEVDTIVEKSETCTTISELEALKKEIERISHAFM